MLVSFRQPITNDLHLSGIPRLKCSIQKLEFKTKKKETYPRNLTSRYIDTNELTSKKFRIQSSSLILPRIWSIEFRVKSTYTLPISLPDPETFYSSNDELEKKVLWCYDVVSRGETALSSYRETENGAD
jgi:hypothetical protein